MRIKRFAWSAYSAKATHSSRIWRHFLLVFPVMRSYGCKTQRAVTSSRSATISQIIKQLSALKLSEREAKKPGIGIPSGTIYKPRFLDRSRPFRFPSQNWICLQYRNLRNKFTTIWLLAVVQAVLLRPVELVASTRPTLPWSRHSIVSAVPASMLAAYQRRSCGILVRIRR